MYVQAVDITDELEGYGRRRRELGAASRELEAGRDDLIIRAFRAGLAINRIHKLSSIGRTTIYRVLEVTSLPGEGGQP